MAKAGLAQRAKNYVTRSSICKKLDARQQGILIRGIAKLMSEAHHQGMVDLRDEVKRQF